MYLPYAFFPLRATKSYTLGLSFNNKVNKVNKQKPSQFQNHVCRVPAFNNENGIFTGI